MLAILLTMLAGDPTMTDAVRAAIDPCRPRDDGTIVVCRHDPAARDRYRLPPIDRSWDPLGTARSVSGERNDLTDAGGAGDLTAGSCSAVGPGGFTGCQVRTWRRNDQQKGW